MTNAFRCDECNEYFDGTPYAHINFCFSMRSKNTWDTPLTKQVCKECFNNICDKNGITETMKAALIKGITGGGEIKK